MHKYIFIIVLLFWSFSSKAQINISQTGTVTQWVQNVLTGTGVTVSNVTYTGDLQSIAKFTSGTNPTGLGMTDGLILCTGNATSINGAASSFASTTTSGGSDPLLAALITYNINDAAVLEFDFVPLSDTVKFKYIFGSEEYPEYSLSSFNDVFGFFISGYNPNGGMYADQNVALLPGTSTAVSIANINNGTTNTGPCVNCSYYVNNSSNSYIAYDALTIPMYAIFQVVPCFTYHIKLVIGDASDAVFDSGVFLEANSFSSNIIYLSSSTTNSIDTMSIEGCNNAVIGLKIPYVTPVDKVFYYATTGTAINGVDYVSLSGSVTVPAGSDSTSIIIEPIFDGINEGLEYIELYVATSSCTYDTIVVYIADNTVLECNLGSDTVLCNNDTMTITPNVSGGYEPYSYLWNTGDTTSSIFSDPITTTTYTLTLTDACNTDTSDQIIIYDGNPQITIIGDSACTYDSAYISVLGDNSYSYLWNTGEQTQDISFIVILDEYYSVVATDTFGCIVTDSTFVKNYQSPKAITSDDTTICNRSSANVRVIGNYASYAWSNGFNTKNINVSPSILSRYSVTITNSNHCSDTASTLVDVLDIPIAVISSMDDTLCLGKSTNLIGSIADEYLWSTGEMSQNISVQPSQKTKYSLKLTNQYLATRCSHDTSYTLNVERCNFFYTPNAFTPNDDGLNDDFGIEGQYVALDEFHMYIFNKWGEVIFKADDPSIRWDGTYKGSEVAPGVYTYMFEITETLREPYILKGTVHLLR
ncbi:MAG: choice-of-anchor L domain-containing protein [Bacteroidales bacterium]|nr:choice-of-anchor L domain-containing protein [Bacteroidales bacterium]